MMDGSQFDTLIRSLTTSRRSLLGGASALAGGWLGVANTEARNKRKKKQKGKKNSRKLVLNQYGCVDAGQACRGNNSLCCSGICEGAAPRKGKPDQSRCVPHNAGVCTLQTNTCEVGVEVPCNPNTPLSFCMATTGNAAFCADTSAGASTHCRVCSKDTDCQGEFGAGAACIVLDGPCTPVCVATGRTACLPAGD
jgi:hypothetical protein